MTYYCIITGYPMAFIFRQLISVTGSKLAQVIMNVLLILYVLINLFTIQTKKYPFFFKEFQQ